MILAHKTAILARLNADPLLATCGHEGVVLDRPETYWTLFTDSGVRSSDRFGGLPINGTFNYWVHSVGRVPEQAQRLAEHVIAQLAGWQPVVPDYAPFRVEHAASSPTDLDSTVRPPLHVAIDHFRLTTQPA